MQLWKHGLQILQKVLLHDYNPWNFQSLQPTESHQVSILSLRRWLFFVFRSVFFNHSKI